VLGGLAGAVLVLLAAVLPKGPYVLYALVLAALLAVLWRGSGTGGQRIFIVAGWFALCVMAANVANYWGGGKALHGMLGALAVIVTLVLGAVFANRPLWPGERRWQATFMSAAVAVNTAMVVFAGGAYMGDRFSTSSHDLEERLNHWALSASMLQTPLDLWFGKGLGRYPANYFFSTPDSKFVGTARLIREGDESWLSLVGPRHSVSFGDMFRISQRLPFAAAGPFTVSLKIRARNDVRVHAEVCEKHLLYVAGCAIGSARVKAGEGWRDATIKMAGGPLRGGPWYAPRMRMFSVAIGSMSGAAEIDDIVLTGPGGESLLTNGNFSRDMQRWFFSSDRDHMPWHAKNILVNVLFDQGVFGLALFLLMNVAALWRLNLGKARWHELAPCLSAAIVGFLVVGIFDSLIDVPRLALLFYVLILLSLLLDSTPGAHGKPAGARDFAG
jgi:hypothetical protein